MDQTCGDANSAGRRQVTCVVDALDTAHSQPGGQRAARLSLCVRCTAPRGAAPPSHGLPLACPVSGGLPRACGLPR